MNDPWFEWWATQQVFAMKVALVMIPLMIIWVVFSIWGNSRKQSKRKGEDGNGD